MNKKKEKKVNIVPIKLDVAFALEQWTKGSAEHYTKLIKQLSQDVPIDILKAYLKEFLECVTIFDHRFYDFIRVILHINWYTSESLCKKYFEFLVSLAIAQPVHLTNVLISLVQRFRPSIDPLQPALIQQRQHLTICSHVQVALKSIHDRVPMMQTILIPIIIKQFPYFKYDVFQVECYVRNLLQLTLLMPRNRLKILELIISKITAFDVSCPRHDILKAEKDDETTDSVFKMDVDQKTDDVKPLMKLPEAEVLDVLMNLLLTYIKNTCYNNFDNSVDSSTLQLDWSGCKKLFKELLLLFETIILPTHGTYHVQYIFFYICKYNVQLCDGFLDFLWKKYHNPNTNAVFRQACASYLGSFLARSVYLPTSSIMMCLEEFCNWIHYYIELVIITKEKNSNLFALHGPFYYLCHAVFYVFVFRHRDIFESPKGCNRVAVWNFQSIITCHLNPLKYCAPHLVEKFSCIMRLYQLAMCDTIIERNRREVCDHGSLEIYTAKKIGTLDLFFPFDPCLLPRTNKFVKPLYKEYEESHINVAASVQNDDEVDFLPLESFDPMAATVKESDLLLTTYLDCVSQNPKKISQPLLCRKNEVIEEMMSSL